MTSVFFFVPNVIGYVRIVTGLAALHFAFDAAHWPWFAALYFVSYALDAVDGVAARALKQTSRFGAVLDMVTDRFCTAALLAILARVRPEWATAFIYLMILDISSHWAQMYSTLVGGHASHKSLKDETPLLRFYYTAPYALFWVCALNELFLLSLYLLTHMPEIEAATPFLNAVPGLSVLFSRPLHLLEVAAYVSFPVFALKQIFSVIQLATAAQRIVALDEEERSRRGQ